MPTRTTQEVLTMQNVYTGKYYAMTDADGVENVVPAFVFGEIDVALNHTFKATTDIRDGQAFDDWSMIQSFIDNAIMGNHGTGEDYDQIKSFTVRVGRLVQDDANEGWVEQAQPHARTSSEPPYRLERVDHTRSAVYGPGPGGPETHFLTHLHVHAQFLCDRLNAAAAARAEKGMI